MSAKLVFNYGTVCSSKTAQLLLIAHNYEECGERVVTIKPAVDTRSELIETRAKIPSRKVDIIIKDTDTLNSFSEIINSADVVLVDECQFLTVTQVEELRNISTDRNINILCFGLRTDFNTNLFPASKRLFELADEINEVRTVCSVCGKRAGFNLKLDKVNAEGNIIPSWDSFSQRCYLHYINRE